ncbi:hypothetical protein QTP88_019867 [Uroleucon formosanum]
MDHFRPNDDLEKPTQSSYYQKVRGLRSKLCLLRYNIHTMCFNYFKLTEIWLNNNINDCELGFDNFSLYESDKNYAISNCNKGGGVAICVNNKFTFKIIVIPNITIDQLIVAVIDVPMKCNGCASLVHKKCSGLTTSEIKCVSLKKRILKYFCAGCENYLKDLPLLKLLIKKLLVEVEGLNNSHSFSFNNSLDNEFIINEINDRNSRVTNLIFYNIEECDSNKTDEVLLMILIRFKILLNLLVWRMKSYRRKLFVWDVIKVTNCAQLKLFFRRHQTLSIF